MACLAYEGVLLFAVVFLAALAYSVLTDQKHALAGRQGLGAFAFVVVPAVYFIGYWWRTGQTLPMQTWQIRLETTHGKGLNFRLAVLRFLACGLWLGPPLLAAAAWGPAVLRWLLPLTAVWVLLYALSSRLNPSGQFWHDHLCGTRLVDTRTESRL